MELMFKMYEMGREDGAAWGNREDERAAVAEIDRIKKELEGDLREIFDARGVSFSLRHLDGLRERCFVGGTVVSVFGRRGYSGTVENGAASYSLNVKVLAENPAEKPAIVTKLEGIIGTEASVREIKPKSYIDGRGQKRVGIHFDTEEF